MAGGSRSSAGSRLRSFLSCSAFRAVAATLTAVAAFAFVVWCVDISMADGLDNHATKAVGRSPLSRHSSAGEREAISRSAGLSAATSSGAEPRSLSGSTAPRLPLDVRGHLAIARAARDFFDYFLTARHEVTPEVLDAIVRRAIAAQLEGSNAESEALDLWQRYRSYLAGLADLAPLQVPAFERGASANADALQAAFDARASLASRTMGAAWSEAFFGEQWRTTAYSLARLRIASDPTLTDEQRAARLDAWRQSLPAEERASLEREAKAQASVDTIAELARQQGSADELRAQATQALGAQVAERIVQTRRHDDEWRARYADYSAQRARIDATGLSAEAYEGRVTQLRERMFPSAGERVRAAALDAGAAR